MIPLADVCYLLHKCTASKIIITAQFRSKALGRKYHEGHIKEIMCTNPLVGIIDQSDGTYKLIYEDTDEDDVVIACRLSDDHLQPITVYPNKKSKRLRLE